MNEHYKNVCFMENIMHVWENVIADFVTHRISHKFDKSVHSNSMHASPMRSSG